MTMNVGNWWRAQYVHSQKDTYLFRKTGNWTKLRNEGEVGEKGTTTIMGKEHEKKDTHWKCVRCWGIGEKLRACMDDESSVDWHRTLQSAKVMWHESPMCS
jgi:hypothetical protein